MTIQYFNTKRSKFSESENFIDPSVVENISVTKPYFALENLNSCNEYIYAEFITELINIDEQGPVSGAEVGRHMAILGSLVLSRENPKKERHHYLATDAIITRLSSQFSSKYKLRCRAKLLSFNRKKGVVYGEILDHDGNVMYQIEVTYMILEHAIFERMFQEHKVVNVIDPSYNPYTTDVNFLDLTIGVKSCYASIGAVMKEDCTGHFNNYPAMPVARMGTSMGKLAGLHFMYLNPSEKKKYLVSKAEIHARQLIFAGEIVKFRTEIIDPNPEKGMIIKTIAYNDHVDFIAESIANYHY